MHVSLNSYQDCLLIAEQQHMLSNQQQTPAEAKTHAMVKTARGKKSSTGSRFVQDGYSVLRGIWKEGTLETLQKIAKKRRQSLSSTRTLMIERTTTI
eukprot:scaffold4648_cov74-Cylindrotheca_fusiformis.AAC.1